MPAINLFLNILQVVFAALKVAEQKSNIHCFSECYSSQVGTVVWDSKFSNKMLGKVLYENKVAFSVILYESKVDVTSCR